MNRYELTYIIDATLEDSARKELIEKVVPPFLPIDVTHGRTGGIIFVDETKRTVPAFRSAFRSDGG